jgi:TonB-dependent SusC/RagA subfamily outer membrane receptor
MSASSILPVRLGSASALVLLLGCGAPELPPAGPAPGEVDVGYGGRPAGSTTGAVTSVSEAETAATGKLRVEELLRGRIAGLEVTSTANGVRYRLRGVGSILADQEPLFVVDGVPTSAGQLNAALSGVIAEDIRQIDVLKDVASTSIYGMRGAGGVIIITTRR